MDQPTPMMTPDEARETAADALVSLPTMHRYLCGMPVRPAMRSRIEEAIAARKARKQSKPSTPPPAARRRRAA